MSFFIIPQSGTAIKIEENTPEINPTSKANEKLKILGAPNSNMATTTTMTVSTVLIERVIVCRIDRLTISSICSGDVITLAYASFHVRGQTLQSYR